jgi:hypothetical protein
MRCEAWCRAAHLEELSEALSSRAAIYPSCEAWCHAEQSSYPTSYLAEELSEEPRDMSQARLAFLRHALRYLIC